MTRQIGDEVDKGGSEVEFETDALVGGIDESVRGAGMPPLTDS